MGGNGSTAMLRLPISAAAWVRMRIGLKLGLMTDPQAYGTEINDSPIKYPAAKKQIQGHVGNDGRSSVRQVKDIQNNCDVENHARRIVNRITSRQSPQPAQ